ncbi:MAG: DUF5119 domain-containing protein [Bacteroides sp]|nr:DUF5119 domain-containing protein [Bacteroides sp.]
MRKRLLYIIMMFSLTALFWSCERRPLVELTNQTTVRVLIKMNTILNVTTGIYNEYIPKPDITPNVIRVMFYDPETKELLNQGFVSQKGVDADGNEYIEGQVSIRPGTYDVLCYNFDTPSTIVENENNMHDIMAYTSEISEALYGRFGSRNEMTIKPKVYYEPDHLLVAREEKIEVPEHTELLVINMEAFSVVDSYYIQIRLKNGKYASDATALLTDLSPSNRIGLNKRTDDEYAATFFEMHRSKNPAGRAEEQEVLCAVFNTFGKRPDDIDPSVESQLFVTFNVITTEGKVVEMTVDMDEIFLSEDAQKRHWLLIDKVFEIPVPETSGSGFQPGVGEWDEEHGTVEIK